MTLKELRIKKGLSQQQCASYLNMSTRNYQNYENNDDKVNTYKYNAIYSKLQEYGSLYINNETNQFNTNVIIGNGLKALCSQVKDYKKRDCYDKLYNYINRKVDGKVCILYGLRRTGKTTLLFQVMNELPIEKIAYIKALTTDNMAMLIKDLNILFNKGYKYVFIDEITLLEDFINTAAILSDYFALSGMKIVLSGTDSLGFAMANKDELYDRSVMVHTSFISFKEYKRILNINSIDTYIEYGGTLKIENMNYDDIDYKNDEVSFANDESTRKYIDSSIARNIQHTLKNDKFGSYFNELIDLYEHNELTNVINRLIESMNHEFVLSVIKNKFKSSDLGSTKQLLLHEFPKSTSTILYEIDEKAVIDRLKRIIDIKENDETIVKVSDIHIQKIKKYLIMLDLLVSYTERYESKAEKEVYIICQSGMRYAISKALVYSLLQDEYFKEVSLFDKQYIIDKILLDVKGRMLEDIVLLQTSKTINKNFEVFKFKFDDNSEIDMIIYDKINNTCKIYEIKHSSKVVENQTRYLKDEDKCLLLEKRFGKIIGKYVLYKGENLISDDITYLNVEEFLCEN